jgi:hypothetical protein
MLKSISIITLLLVICLPGSKIFAQSDNSICPGNYKPVTLNISVLASTNLAGCPLLEERRLRRLVDRNFPGTVFAYPIPGTCLSGVIVSGEMTTTEGTITLGGTTESAQRFFPEAAAINPARGGVFLSGVSEEGVPFVSGAAATIANLVSADKSTDIQLVLTDRFTIKLDSFPFIDVEDLEIVGAKGAAAKGRLAAVAQIFGDPSGPIVDALFSVQGEICLRQ